jgi:hypothetical protein
MMKLEKLCKSQIFSSKYFFFHEPIFLPSFLGASLGLPGGFLGATVGLLGGLVIVSIMKSPGISPRNPQKAREGNRFSKKKSLLVKMWL